MNLFDLQYSFESECEFIGDNEDQTYLIKLRVPDKQYQVDSIFDKEMDRADIENLIDGLDQLKNTLTKAIEQ